MHFTLSSAIGNAFKATTSSPTSHTNDHGAKSPIYSRQGWTVFFAYAKPWLLDHENMHFTFWKFTVFVMLY